MKNKIKATMVGLGLMATMNVMADTYISTPVEENGVRTYTQLEINDRYNKISEIKENTNNSERLLGSDLVKKVKVSNTELINSNCSKDITIDGYVGKYSDCKYNNYFTYDNKQYNVPNSFELKEVLVVLEKKVESNKTIYSIAEYKDLFDSLESKVHIIYKK